MSENFQKRRKSRVPRASIMISGESTTIPDAANKLGMDEEVFSRKRKYILSKLEPKEALTWEHFER